MSDTPPAAPSPGVGAPASPGPEVGDAEPLSVGRRLSRILAVVVALGIAGLWAYALWGPVQRTPQGRLDSMAFPTAAEPICAEAVAAIDALPLAFETRDATVRADVVDDANEALATMLGRLEAMAPPATDADGRMIEEWLADWRTFLGDRERYVDALASDPDARLLVSEKERRQVTEPVDYFASVNDMPACATPGDLA